MWSIFRDLKQFYKQVATLSSGKAVAFLIPVLVTPILTRIYSAEAIGIYGMFVALLSILNTPGTMRFELAMLLEKREADLRSLITLTAGIALVYFVLLNILALMNVYVFHFTYSGIQLESWIFFLPLAILLLNVMKIAEAIRIRSTQYSRVSFGHFISAFTRAGIQVGASGFIGGAVTLIIGFVGGLFIGNAVLLKFKNLGLSSWQACKRVWVKYRKYPFVTTPSTVLSLLAGNALVLLLPVAFSATLVGFYVLAIRIAGLPGELIGMNISTVFMRNAAQEKAGSGYGRRFFDKLVLSLIAVFVPLFILFAFIAEPVFGFVFGQNWRTAGEILVIFLPLSLVKLLVIATSATIHIKHRQEIGLWYNLSVFALTVFLFLLLHQFSMQVLFLAISLTLSFAGFVILLIYRKLLSPEPA